jgi:hypothetical protein
MFRQHVSGESLGRRSQTKPGGKPTDRQTSATPSDKIARILCSLLFFHDLLFPIPIPKP